MRKRLGILLSSIFLFSILNTRVSYSAEVEEIKKYSVNVSDGIRVGYDGINEEIFGGSFKTGFGSAITFKEFNENNQPVFYALTDRGPNGESPKYKIGNENSPSKFFPTPSFTPSVGILKIENNGAYISESIELKDNNGNNLSGLPIEPGRTGSTGEVALDMNLNMLSYDNNGIDSEGISIDKDGNIWICDEYGPFLIKFDSTGKMIEKYSPGDGLPEILKYRIPNRGFEGLTITPSGKILVAVQSVLDIEGETKKTSLFTRILEFDPETKKSKMFAYPVELGDYNSPSDCKIGDIYALSDEVLIVIEQGLDKNKNMQNYIYKVDLSKAHDITNLKYEGKELEYVNDKSLIENINFAEKELLVDLRENGWKAEKAEGITMLPDKKTIVVINDNDFEISTVAVNENNEEVKIGNYIYDPETKEFVNGEIKSDITISLDKNSEESELWAIKLKNEIEISESKIENSKSQNISINNFKYVFLAVAAIVLIIIFLKFKRK